MQPLPQHQPETTQPSKLCIEQSGVPPQQPLDIPIVQQFPTVIEFFKQFTAYSIMPTSARVLTIDADTSVYRAFRIMGDNSVSSAYIWNKQTQLYTYVLTATDIMSVCVKFYDIFFGPNATQDPVVFAQRHNIHYEGKIGLHDMLSHISIKSIKRQSQLQLIHTNTTLYDAIEKMIDKGVHRLPVIDNDGSIVLSLTYRQICRFLVSKFRFNSQVLTKSIIDTDVPNREFKTVSINDSLYDVTKVLIENQLSVVPVMDDNGDLVNVFSKYDFQTIANNGHIDLSMPLQKALSQRPDYVEGCVVMPIDCTIGQLLRQIADKNLHRMMLTEKDNPKKLIAVVSLRHVLRYLTQSDVYEDEQVNYNSIAATMKHSMNSLTANEPHSQRQDVLQLPEDDQDWRLFQRLQTDEQY